MTSEPLHYKTKQNDLCAQRKLRSACASVQSDQSLCCSHEEATHWAHSKDSDQTGWMSRLMWVFAGRTGDFVVFSYCDSSVTSENLDQQSFLPVRTIKVFSKRAYALRQTLNGRRRWHVLEWGTQGWSPCGLTCHLFGFSISPQFY